MQANKPLTQWPDRYNSDLLKPIVRADIAAAYPNGSQRPIYGLDLWRVYDFFCLNKQGHPEVSAVTIQVPQSSPMTVESKSLKLYLNGFAHTQLESDSKLQKIIADDISKIAKKPVQVKLFKLSDLQQQGLQELPGLCLDDLLDQGTLSHCPQPKLLPGKSDEVQGLSMHSHLLRTLCPLTGQPDLASIFIKYSGEAICHQSLLAYILSKRQEACFHETAVEEIFYSITEFCNPKKLSLYACFQRRGGIDINPYRSSEQEDINIPRISRQ